MPEDVHIHIDADQTLWLTEISKHTFDDQRLAELENGGGLYLILEEKKSKGFTVLAKVASRSAGKSMLQVVAWTL